MKRWLKIFDNYWNLFKWRIRVSIFFFSILTKNLLLYYFNHYLSIMINVDFFSSFMYWMRSRAIYMYACIYVMKKGTSERENERTRKKIEVQATAAILAGKSIFKIFGWRLERTPRWKFHQMFSFSRSFWWCNFYQLCTR